MTATEDAETTPTPEQRFEVLCAAMREQFQRSGDANNPYIPLPNVISSKDLLRKDYDQMLKIFSAEIKKKLSDALAENPPEQAGNDMASLGAGDIYSVETNPNAINPYVLRIGDEHQYYATQEPYISALEAVFKPEEIKQLAEQVREQFLKENKSAVLAAKVSKILPDLNVESVTHTNWQGNIPTTTRERDITINCAPTLIPFLVGGLRGTIKAMSQPQDGASGIRARLQKEHLTHNVAENGELILSPAEKMMATILPMEKGKMGKIMLSPELAEYLANNQELFTQKFQQVSAAALSGGRQFNG